MRWLPATAWPQRRRREEGLKLGVWSTTGMRAAALPAVASEVWVLWAGGRLGRI